MPFDIQSAFQPLDNRMTGACPACGSDRFAPHTDYGRRLFARSLGVQAQLFSCRDCAHKAFQPELDVKLLADIYADPYFRSGGEEEAYRDQYARAQAPYIDFALRIQTVARQWGLPSNARIHEFGCGSGVTVKHLRDMGYEATGSDWSPAAVAFAHAMGNPHVFREDMNVRDAFSGERLDMVLNLHAIEHVPRPVETLRGFAGVMDEGTILFLNTNQGDSITNRRFGMHFDTWYYFPQHLHYFSPRSFDAIARRAGFKILDIRTSPRWFEQIDAALGPPAKDDTHAKRLARVTRDMANQEMEMTLALVDSRFRSPSIDTPSPVEPDAQLPATHDSHEDYFLSGGPWTAIARLRTEPEQIVEMTYAEPKDEWHWDAAYVGDHWMVDSGGAWTPGLRFTAPSAGMWEFDIVAALRSLHAPPAIVNLDRGGSNQASMGVDGLIPQHLVRRVNLLAGQSLIIDVVVDAQANEQVVTCMIAARLQP